MSTANRTDLYKKTNIKNWIHSFLQAGSSLMYWRMPNRSETILLVCTSGASMKDSISLEETTPGFVFAPFDPQQSKYFFRADRVFRFYENELVDGSDFITTEFLNQPIKNQEPSSGSPYHISKKTNPAKPSDFLSLVKSCIEKTKSEPIEKIVASTCKEIEVAENFDAVNFFNRLCENHPQAFVSLISSPETGTWIGASPELLIRLDAHDKFKTIALAGTQKSDPNVDLKSVAWTQKEIEEQALVSRYIINCFKKIRVREYTEHGPRTISTGNLFHLQTDYEIDMKEVNFPQLGSVMLNLLHPTSAVCGMPFEPSFDFLQKQEGYDREFYSGYLGPVNFNGESNLFVNLRCLQRIENGVRIYAGAGVTADSIAEKEVDEVEMKIKTLSQLIY